MLKDQLTVFSYIGSLAELRKSNYRGNPPEPNPSDVSSRYGTLWSKSHRSPLPSGTINEERFEERNGRPGFWHEIVFPIDRVQAEASVKTVESNFHTYLNRYLTSICLARRKTDIPTASSNQTIPSNN